MTLQNTMESSHIVILGAGFGGLSAALELAKLRKWYQQQHQGVSNVTITIIDKNDFQLFTPDLYEIAAASKIIESEQDLKNTVCLDVKLALAQQEITYKKAAVTSIDPRSKQVHTDTEQIAYDYLIIALGSEPFYFGIPGMQEHAIPFKWIDDAIKIRQRVHHLRDTVRNTVGSTGNTNPHVIVCGGGSAGVEVAAELMKASTTKPQNPFALTIIEGQKTLLPQLNPKTQHAATRRLKQLGVDIKTNCMIAQAEEGKVITTTGEHIAGDLIIWAGGIKANSILEKSDFTLGKRGQIPIHATLQSQQYDSVFVVGDAAQLELQPGMYCPQTAHEAYNQGPVIARNIMNTLTHTPLIPYVMKNQGSVVTLGGKKGVVELSNGLVLTGIIGWFVRKYVDFRHFKAVLPFMHACSVWYKGVRVFMKND